VTVVLVEKVAAALAPRENAGPAPMASAGPAPMASAVLVEKVLAPEVILAVPSAVMPEVAVPVVVLRVPRYPLSTAMRSSPPWTQRS